MIRTTFILGRAGLLGLLLMTFPLTAATPVSAQTPAPQPILDVHLHAFAADSNGPPPIYICAPYDRWPAWDPKTGSDAVADMVAGHPPCAHPLVSPKTDAEMQQRMLAILEKYNITAIASGTDEIVARWGKASNGRVLAAVVFDPGSGKPTPAELRQIVKQRPVVAFAEIAQQYQGISPDDPRMEPYYALAEELDIPIGIHIGPGPPGIGYFGAPGYRMKLSSLLLLEEPLARHPKMRLWAMHAGWPLGDDAVAALYAHPQLYVDVAVIDYTTPRAEFYRYLQRLIDAGFEDRILFGSDEMIWPEAEVEAIRRIQEAPFLTPAQKRDIFYNNAARFLRLNHK